MTAPAAGDGDLRAQLAEALQAVSTAMGPGLAAHFADALLPLVSRHADQRAAEELRNLRTALSNDEDAPTDAALEGLDFTLRVLAAGAARLDPQHTDKETDR